MVGFIVRLFSSHRAVPHIHQAELMRLCQRWEPEASQSPPGFRKATCVVCARPMVRMWHYWMDQFAPDGSHWVKEVHLCSRCATKYA